MTSRFLRSVTLASLAIAYSLAASAGAAPPQAPVVETASGSHQHRYSFYRRPAYCQ